MLLKLEDMFAHDWALMTVQQSWQTSSLGSFEGPICIELADLCIHHYVVVDHMIMVDLRLAFFVVTRLY